MNIPMDQLFFEFEAVSKVTGNRHHLMMFGTDSEDARQRLVNGSLKDLDWSEWTLEDA